MQLLLEIPLEIFAIGAFNVARVVLAYGLPPCKAVLVKLNTMSHGQSEWLLRNESLIVEAYCVFIRPKNSNRYFKVSSLQQFA